MPYYPPQTSYTARTLGAIIFEFFWKNTKKHLTVNYFGYTISKRLLLEEFMAIGIVCIVIGVILFGSAASGVSNILQQTVQYLIYVCSSIFFVGGFILIELNEIIKKLSKKDDKLEINPPLKKND
jgi:hypothetical protein